MIEISAVFLDLYRGTMMWYASINGDRYVPAFTGKTHTGICRITRPNGDVSVYERVTQYDPQTKLFGMQDRIC